MSWQPTASIGTSRARARLLERVRTYFRNVDVLEVETPALTRGTATDPNIESITAANGPETCYLHTSPEHFMKRLLAAGYPDIYQVCRVFRAGESGARHLPEFTMIEWYRLEFGLDDIIADALSLTDRMLDRTTLDEPLQQSYAEVFESALDLDAFAATPDEIADALDADPELATLSATIETPGWTSQWRIACPHHFRAID